jgi:hypothetical protein
VEERMRKEFYLARPWRFLQALFIIFGVVFIVTNGADLLFHSPPSDRLIGDVVSMLGGMIITAAFVAAWMKKPDDPPPLLIAIDDSGLWLQEVGELMRWSEIQQVRISSWSSSLHCMIVWRHRSIRIAPPEHHYRDGDGKMRSAFGVFREIKSCWKRYNCCSRAERDGMSAA